MIICKSRKRHAGVAELADALDSGSSGSNLVEVQVLSPALFYVWLKTFRVSREVFFLFIYSFFKFRIARAAVLRNVST